MVGGWPGSLGAPQAWYPLQARHPPPCAKAKSSRHCYVLSLSEPLSAARGSGDCAEPLIWGRAGELALVKPHPTLNELFLSETVKEIKSSGRLLISQQVFPEEG